MPRSLAQDGKIHYMEDTHQANHNGKEEERICMDCRPGARLLRRLNGAGTVGLNGPPAG